MASSPTTSWQTEGEKVEAVTDYIFLASKKSLQMVTIVMKLENLLAPWKESDNKPRQHIKKQRHYFPDKGLYSRSYGFSSSHVWM